MLNLRVRVKVLIALIALLGAYLLWRAMLKVKEGFADETEADTVAKDAAFKERMRLLTDGRDQLKASGDGDYLSDPGPLSDAYTIMASYCS